MKNKNKIEVLFEMGTEEATSSDIIAARIDINEIFNEIDTVVFEMDTLINDIGTVSQFAEVISENGLNKGMAQLAIKRNYNELFIESDVSLQGYMDDIDDVDIVQEVMMNSITKLIKTGYDKFVKLLALLRQMFIKLLRKFKLFSKISKSDLKKKETTLDHLLRQLAIRTLGGERVPNKKEVIDATHEWFTKKSKNNLLKERVVIKTKVQDIVEKIKIIKKLKYAQLGSLITPWETKIKSLRKGYDSDPDYSEALSTELFEAFRLLGINVAISPEMKYEVVTMTAGEFRFGTVDNLTKAYFIFQLFLDTDYLFTIDTAVEGGGVAITKAGQLITKELNEYSKLLTETKGDPTEYRKVQKHSAAAITCGSKLLHEITKMAYSFIGDISTISIATEKYVKKELDSLR